jgi:hypothetical protein
MRRTLTLLAAVLLLGPVAALAQAAVVEKSSSATFTETATGEKVTERTTTVAVVAEKKSPITFTPYGFIMLNALFNDSPFGGNKTYPGLPLPCPGIGPTSGCNVGGAFLMNANQTRVGVRIALDDEAGWTGARLSALLEVDFGGGIAGGSTLASAYYNPVLRLRKAYMDAAWGIFSIRAGQDDRIVSPLRATSLAWIQQPLFQFAGLLHGRNPQLALRLIAEPKDGVSFSAVAAALNPQDVTLTANGVSPGAAADFGAGNRSRMPDLEGRVSAGLRTGGKKLVDLGVWGGVQKNRYIVPSVAGGPANTDTDVTTNIYGADLTLNLWIFSVLGSIYQAHGYDAPGALPAQGVAFALTGAALTVPVDPTAVKATGGWFQLNVRPFDALGLYGGWGGTQTPGKELNGTQFQAVDARVQNFTWAVGAIAYAGKNWRFGAEYALTRSWFWNGGFADGGQLAVSSQLVF